MLSGFCGVGWGFLVVFFSIGWLGAFWLVSFGFVVGVVCLRFWGVGWAMEGFVWLAFYSGFCLKFHSIRM